MLVHFSQSTTIHFFGDLYSKSTMVLKALGKRKNFQTWIYHLSFVCAQGQKGNKGREHTVKVRVDTRRNKRKVVVNVTKTGLCNPVQCTEEAEGL